MYEIRELRELTPRLEPTHFSGGWNNSAIDRNRRRLIDAPMYRLGRVILVAVGMRRILEEAIEKREWAPPFPYPSVPRVDIAKR